MAQLVRTGGGTLYHQVLSKLVEAIESGKIAPGEKLPTEAELMQTYGVSRTTARRALDELHRQGLVRREPGRGTFWVDTVLHADLPYLHSFSDEIRRLGYRPGAKLLLREERKADQTLAMQLNVATGSPVLYVRRLRTADDRPIFTCDSYLSLVRFPALREVDCSVSSFYELFEQVTARRIIRATQWIGAAAAEDEIARLLELAPGAPVLWLKRITYVEGDQPVESVEAFFHSRRYHYYSELLPQPSTVVQLPLALRREAQEALLDVALSEGHGEG